MTYEVDPQSIMKMAANVARNYKRRCPWADVDDMTSRGCIAIVAAQQTFDPDVGTEFKDYAMRAAALQVKDLLWRQFSPVSGGLHNPRKHLAHIERVQAEADHTKPQQRDRLYRHETWSDSPCLNNQKWAYSFPKPLMVDADADTRLDVETWRQRVRARLVEVLSALPRGDVAVQILVHGRTCAEMMDATGLGRRVYRIVYRARQVVRDDLKLKRLWQETPY